jgi:hypothetical protein
MRREKYRILCLYSSGNINKMGKYAKDKEESTLSSSGDGGEWQA